MIFDIMTYGLLASIFVVQLLRMFVDKPKNNLQVEPLPWRRLLRRRSQSNSQTSDF